LDEQINPRGLPWERQVANIRCAGNTPIPAHRALLNKNCDKASGDFRKPREELLEQLKNRKPAGQSYRAAIFT